MGTKTITKPVFRCNVCGHNWNPRDPKHTAANPPRCCAKCKTPYWERTKK